MFIGKYLDISHFDYTVAENRLLGLVIEVHHTSLLVVVTPPDRLQSVGNRCAIVTVVAFTLLLFMLV